MDHLADSFLFSECKRWDVKGKSYFDYPNKDYCEDIGLRNARIGFRQQEMTHIMENIIYNELLIRECSVLKEKGVDSYEDLVALTDKLTIRLSPNALLVTIEPFVTNTRSCAFTLTVSSLPSRRR